MSAISPLPVCPKVADNSEFAAQSGIVSRIGDYLEIVKPRISLMVLLTVSCGFVLAMETPTVSLTLLHACAGIAIVAVGSSAINQWIERETDGKMRRTKNRPLPSGRLEPVEVVLLGFTAAIVGCTYLACMVNVATAVGTGITFVLYAGVYTPLKRMTPLCTAIGAIPGAMPPVLGWLAAGGQFDEGAFALFGTLFLWQFPHFFAIAWLYRDDYRHAGLKMLPACASYQHVTGLMAVVYSLCLIPISILPCRFGLAGEMYMIAALVLGMVYFVASTLFAWHETRSNARRLLWTSLIYLPGLLLILVWDHQRLLDRF